jgi:uncharacterized membrane protein YcaP (DUF421 family)
MRLAGIGRMEEVSWAILEPQGKISFIKRSDAEQGGRAQQQDDDGPAR